MAYPSTLSTYTDPVPTDRLSTTPHSSIETAQNTGLREIQAFVGTLSSVAGTLMYDIRGADSNGGGHVQTANKGGTGQTTFTKGDILVASSSSVITKLAVGANDTALTADSTQATGVKWGTVANATNIQNQTYTYARASIMSGSVYGVVLSQNPSIISDGLGMVIKFPNSNTTSLLALSVNTSSSGSVAALLKKYDLTNIDTGKINASMIGLVTFDSVSSMFQLLNLPATATTYKSGVTGRDGGSSPSSTMAIAHGLGTIPKYVRIMVDKTNGTNLLTSRSDGTYDGTNTNSIEYHQNATEGATNKSTSLIALVTPGAPGSNDLRATISTDATNINLAWEVVGSPGNSSVMILWEAQA